MRKSSRLNTTCPFRQGVSRVGYCFSLFMAGTVALIFLPLAIFSLISFQVLSLLISIAFLLLIFPRLLRYAKRNRPATYDPFTLPDGVLPRLGS